MRRRTLLAAGLAVPAGLLAGLDEALAILPVPRGPSGRSDVAALLSRARRLFDIGDYRGLVADLPDLLATAHAAGADGADPHAQVRLASCYHLATEGLSKIGRYDVGRITADRAGTYAHLSGSPVAVAASARVLGIVLRHEGRNDAAQRVTLDAAGKVEATGLVTPALTATYARLLCTCAYNAAKAGDRDRALEMIGHAEQAATRLHRYPGPPGPPATITPAAVTLYRVGVHWALGDAGAALHAGRDLRPGQFATAERRGRLHTDLARAWWRWGKPDQTARALLAAHREAPAEVRDRPAIRSIATELTTRHATVPGVRELATAMARGRR